MVRSVSRQPRAGEAAPRRSFRATDTEWSAWERAAKAEGIETVSAAIVKQMNEWSARVEARRGRSKR